HHRERAGRPRHSSGQQVWRASLGVHAGEQPDVRQDLSGVAAGRRRNGHHKVPVDRHGRRVSPAERRTVRAVRRAGRILRRHSQRGPYLQGAQVVLVGGGNSAGQAAVFLSQHASRVLLVIRGDDLYKHMSSYLAKRIEQTPNIELLRNSTVQRMNGDGQLNSIEIVNSKTGEKRTVETPAVFSFIGAVPRTD